MIRNPPQPPCGHTGNAPLDPVAIAQFLLAVAEQLDQRLVDVAETEEADVVGVYEDLLDTTFVGRPRE